MGQAGHPSHRDTHDPQPAVHGVLGTTDPADQGHLPGTDQQVGPPKDSWTDLPSGKSYPWYTIAFTGDKKLRVELYVDNPEPAAQQHLWQQLAATRDAIDASLPNLSWEPLEGKRASPIALYSPFDASVDREDDWDTYRTWLIDTLGTFRAVIQPHIDQLAAYDGGASQ